MYINRDEDIQTIVLLPDFTILIILLCCIVTHDECILGQFLEEAFRGCAVDVEVQGLDWGKQRTQR